MLRLVSWWCLLVVGFAGALAVGGCFGDPPGEPHTNHPPTLVPHDVSTDEDVAIEIRVLDGASDLDGDPLTVLRGFAPPHDVQIIDGAILRVTPTPNFAGKIDVSYAVSDELSEAGGTATVTVRPVNDPPIATGRIVNLHGKASIMLQGSDVDGDALTFEVVAGPSEGTLSGDPPALQYTPPTGFVGADSFTFRVLDGIVASQPATIAINVTAGSPPTALANAAITAEDSPGAVTLTAFDPEGDPLTYKIELAPEHGTLSGTAPDLIYTPAPDFNGSDSLQFSVHDGYSSSNIATVTVAVAPVNDAPLASPQTVATTEDTVRAITLQGSDIDSSALTFVAQGPPNGTLTGSGANRTYTPNANYHGPDSFTFTVSDGVTTSAPATVTIDVASVEDVPVAQPQSRVLAEDSLIVVTLVGSDGDGDALAFSHTQPAHGTLAGAPPALTYIPAANFNGPDSFTYTVSDGDDTSAPATVSLQVTPVNDSPVATGGSVTTAEDTSIVIALQATDVESSTLTFSIITPPTDGTLSGSGGSRTYTPAPNLSGTRSFKFRATDGSGSFAEATVSIAITPVNDPPTTTDDFAATDPGTTLTFGILGNDFDIDGDAVSLDSVDPPAHGDVEIVDGELVYTPAAGFTGIEVFAYTVTDSQGGFSTSNAHVGVGTFPPGAPTEAIAGGGTVTTGDSVRAPAVSSDGRYAAFVTFAALVSDDTNFTFDVYLYDRGTRTLTRVSVATNGGQSNGSSFNPHLSADGRYVVFGSSAANLVADDTNGKNDVFRHDRVTGETLRISVATGGGQASGNSNDPEISDDGNLVAFASSAFDLIPSPSDANGVSDVFVRDVAAGTTTRVSLTATGGEGDLAASEASISGDGRHVAFSSSATNLVPGDLNNQRDIFVRDRVANTTVRANVSSIGVEANATSLGPSLSRNGRFVAFQSLATNLIGGTPPPLVTQLYVRDLEQQTTSLPLSSSFTTFGGRLSADGRYLTAFTSSGVFIRDRFAGATSTPTGAVSWMWPVLSGNGRYVLAIDNSNGGRMIVAPNPL